MEIVALPANITGSATASEADGEAIRCPAPQGKTAQCGELHEQPLREAGSAQLLLASPAAQCHVPRGMGLNLLRLLRTPQQPSKGSGPSLA